MNWVAEESIFLYTESKQSDPTRWILILYSRHTSYNADFVCVAKLLFDPSHEKTCFLHR